MENKQIKTSNVLHGLCKDQSLRWSLNMTCRIPRLHVNNSITKKMKKKNVMNFNQGL